MSKLSGRTISALKRHGWTRPHEKTIGELLQVPGIGINAITQIAERIYARGRDPHWPEFDPPPEPVKKCSHRVPITQHCERCHIDARLRP